MMRYGLLMLKSTPTAQRKLHQASTKDVAGNFQRDPRLNQFGAQPKLHRSYVKRQLMFLNIVTSMGESLATSDIQPASAIWFEKTQEHFGVDWRALGGGNTRKAQSAALEAESK
jgi:hypothetical protein